MQLSFLILDSWSHLPVCAYYHGVLVRRQQLPRIATATATATGTAGIPDLAVILSLRGLTVPRKRGSFRSRGLVGLRAPPPASSSVIQPFLRQLDPPLRHRGLAYARARAADG